MPSWLFSIEIRAAYGEEFSGDQSAEQAKTMGMACAAGTGSMLLGGAVSALGALRGAIAPAAAGLVGARGLLEMASRGEYSSSTYDASSLKQMCQFKEGRRSRQKEEGFCCARGTCWWGLGRSTWRFGSKEAHIEYSTMTPKFTCKY